MAVSELYVCDRCDQDVTLVHAEEWQADLHGEPQPYPGWGKVGGLLNRVWCESCQAVRPWVFVRLEPPADHAVVAYAEAQRNGATGQETGPCPVCSHPLTWNVDGEPCPHCDVGVLCLRGEWEDAL